MSRIATHLTADHISALFPDVDTPFQDVGDVVNRLLPYHIFQHPREDLLIASKGKRRATETEILQSELAGIYFLRVRCPFPCSWYIQKRNLHLNASSAETHLMNVFGVQGQSRARQVS